MPKSTAPLSISDSSAGVMLRSARAVAQMGNGIGDERETQHCNAAQKCKAHECSDGTAAAQDRLQSARKDEHEDRGAGGEGGGGGGDIEEASGDGGAGAQGAEKKPPVAASATTRTRARANRPKR